ncbi:MAG TPA: adenylate/guanylate cyclase domain-containing protein [Terriglobales bacterium]|nr:adenylate/guanylate cyclase domain-containing protein [Terriglobales bacterium]HYW41017.1 adenylate/guanylate cyclase domain-containing protein [Terriglobales bacterium]
MRCANCGSENPPGTRFCAECGTPFPAKCPKCGAEYSPPAKFCRDCGAPFDAKARATKPAASEPAPVPEQHDPSASEGERKTVTALFADIKGSMEMIEHLDPEEARAIFDPALQLMIEAVRRYGGYVAQSTGDGIFAVFGAPIALEDHPQHALYAALRMQEDLRRYSDRLRERGEPPVTIRIGVNVGEAVVRTIKTGETDTEYTPIGHSISLASRLQALAPAGSIAIGPAVRRLVEGYFTLNGLGLARIKGVTEPVEVYEVTGLGPLRTRLQRSAGRGYTKFVGRQNEIQAMKRAAEQAQAGHGQIVASVAEAGVGKSRLLFEFKAVSRSGWMVLEAFSVSHGQASAFLPLIDLLYSYFEISSEDDARKRREKINGKVLTLDRSLEDTLQYLYGLLGIGDEDNQISEIKAQTRKHRALDAVKRILLRESLNQPLIVVFEDLHWIDSESQAFLNLLADSIGTARILLLANYRPEYRHEWGNKTYYTQLRLDPLGKESADEMLTALLGSEPDLAPLKRIIIEKTEGNPFFMEETVQVLLDEGALVRNGTTRLTKPLRELKIPPTVQAILAARIDRLPAEQKDLLQTLAVIGMEFKLGLVRQVWQPPTISAIASTNPDATTMALTLSRKEADPEASDLESMLSELQLGEFIYEQPAVGDLEYTFKHALTHDVAYNSVLNERRRLLHERIGSRLESVYRDNLGDHLAALTYHYARSGNHEKAVGYCLLAIEQSQERGSVAEAVALFETGLDLLQKLPDDDSRADRELDLRIAAYSALGDIKGLASPEVERSTERAIALCQRPGVNWEKSWWALFGIYFVQQMRPDVRRAGAIASELIARAEERGADGLLAEAGNWLAYIKMVAGDFEAAADAFDRTWTVLESITKPASGLTHSRATQISQAQAAVQLFYTSENNRIISGWNLWFLGYPDRAVERMNSATATDNRRSKSLIGDLNGFAAYICELRRETRQMRAKAEARLAIATASGLFTGRALSEIYLGWADVLDGDLEGGIARMRAHMSQLKAGGSEYITDRGLSFIATALGRAGRYEEGLAALEEAFLFTDRTGQQYYQAELHRLKGELLLGHDAANAAAAEQSFHSALDISRKQRAKSWELRASNSLARLLRDLNRREEARPLLAEVYGSFTEGFDTADLRDARALLQELNA